MTTVRAALSALLLYLVLIQPNHPAAMTWGALAVFPLELPALLAALLALGQSWAGLALRVAAVVLIWAIALLKLADFGTFVAFNRGFNLMVDYNLVPAAWALARGSFGLPLTVLAVGLALIAALGLPIGLWWATGVWAGLRLPARSRVLAGLALVPALALAAAEIGQARRAWALPPGVADAIPGTAFTARVGFERLKQMQATRADLTAFRRAATEDALVGAGPLFDRLDARDLVIVYVESYGRSSFENPLYIPTHSGTLRRIQAELSAQGLAMRSGWARAPMIGGQSWLSHGSVASGLWLDTQGRYRAMVASQRRTLFHLAQEAGFRTVAIMPAHVLPWPEGAFFGFDAIYNAADLGYRGLPFNWVTMPDQFTLHALDRLERDRTDRSPLVVQVALVSSHAPWVPIPELVDWDDIGDGTIFDEWAVSGDPPEVVWRDHDRVRDQFRLAVDYSLQAIGAWAARHAEEPPLMIVMGDHEPARFVSGVEGFDVPVHVIGPEDLVARFEGLGWIEGLLPSPKTPTVRMDRLRDEIVERLSNLDRS
ncbi:sulfatase-like hydrolase/transferase [Pararhodobacter sp. SW119]|uniref:sulfatase-like hydrolase/transferase n=1 Tax=Pararhodobacter sp. SW119 TaxID=2780075 RepID=UPI001ADF058D|nr:sulfatase-like hydrolase/transferase [Pararhodobacter sp. SW119]